MTVYDCINVPLFSSIGKLRAPRRFSRLSWFSCLSSLTEGRCPAEAVPTLDLDRRGPRPLLDGDDRSAVKAGDRIHALSFCYCMTGIVSLNIKRGTWLMHSCKLTAALLEDDGATEFEESLSIEIRSVN